MTALWLWLATNITYMSLIPVVIFSDMPITYEPICYTAALMIASTYEIFFRKNKHSLELTK